MREATRAHRHPPTLRLQPATARPWQPVSRVQCAAGRASQGDGAAPAVLTPGKNAQDSALLRLALERLQKQDLRDDRPVLAIAGREKALADVGPQDGAPGRAQVERR